MTDELIYKGGHMYNPNAVHVEDVDKYKIDKEMLYNILQGIGAMFDTVIDEALIRVLQLISDGGKFNVEEKYNEIMDDLYKEKTLLLIEKLRGCLNESN